MRNGKSIDALPDLQGRANQPAAHRLTRSLIFRSGRQPPLEKNPTSDERCRQESELT
jgi:hypothetical protein